MAGHAKPGAHGAAAAPAVSNKIKPSALRRRGRLQLFLHAALAKSQLFIRLFQKLHGPAAKPLFSLRALPHLPEDLQSRASEVKKSPHPGHLDPQAGALVPSRAAGQNTRSSVLPGLGMAAADTEKPFSLPAASLAALRADRAFLIKAAARNGHRRGQTQSRCPLRN